MLAAIAWRWRAAYVVFSVTVLLNMYAALTNPFYDNPGISDWLGIGPGLRTALPIAVIAIVNGVVFLWALAQLRRSARERLADELERRVRPSPSRRSRSGRGSGRCGPAGPAVPGRSPGMPPRSRPRCGCARPRPLPGRRTGPAGDPAPPVVAVATMPRWTARPSFDELGVIGWFKARYNEPPIRPDRTRDDPARGRRPARPARPVARRRPRDRHAVLRTFRLDAAAADAFRRGLPRPDGHRVPAGLALRPVARHLRVDPSPPRQVPDGGRDRALGRGPRERHERPRGAGPGDGRRAAARRRGPGIEPERPAVRSARRRAAPRRDRHRDPELRPHDAPARSRSSGRPGQRRWPSTTPTSGSSSATTTAAWPPSTSA